jgi:hypothetical protein
MSNDFETPRWDADAVDDDTVGGESLDADEAQDEGWRAIDVPLEASVADVVDQHREVIVDDDERVGFQPDDT